MSSEDNPPFSLCRQAILKRVYTSRWGSIAAVLRPIGNIARRKVSGHQAKEEKKIIIYVTGYFAANKCERLKWKILNFFSLWTEAKPRCFSLPAWNECYYYLKVRVPIKPFLLHQAFSLSSPSDKCLFFFCSLLFFFFLPVFSLFWQPPTFDLSSICFSALGVGWFFFPHFVSPSLLFIWKNGGQRPRPPCLLVLITSERTEHRYGFTSANNRHTHTRPHTYTHT